MRPPLQPAPARPGALSGRRELRLAAGLILALAAARLMALYASPLELYPDEAQYWYWSTDLAAGYYSKPPMIAWLIAGATAVCGDGEACIRTPSPLLYGLAALFVFGAARVLYGVRAAFWSALLAAADVYTAMGEPRAHRGVRSDRARELLAEASAGRLCREAFTLVLAATGHGRIRAALPAGLTEREADVLGLLARGLVSKEIASELGIAPRTVKHHIEHIYEKTGVSTRAAAALFAARNNLVATADSDRRN